ncbi:MAG: hypothetical protein R3F60_29160 [bacterium]
MADVRVSEPHHCTAAEARAKVSTFEEMMSKYGVRADWRGTRPS